MTVKAGEGLSGMIAGAVVQEVSRVTFPDGGRVQKPGGGTAQARGVTGSGFCNAAGAYLQPREGTGEAMLGQINTTGKRVRGLCLAMPDTAEAMEDMAQMFLKRAAVLRGETEAK